MRKLHYSLLGVVCVLALVACTKESKSKIDFEKINASYQMACPDDTTVNCFDVNCALEFPKKSDDPTITMVRNALIIDLFSERCKDMDNDSLLLNYIDFCKEDYELTSDDIEEYIDELPTSSVLALGMLSSQFSDANFYVEKLEAVPLFQNEKLLTYEATRYTFTGGAHGVSTTTCWVFNLENGQQLTEDDIFYPGSADALTALLRQALNVDAANRGISIDEFFLDQLLPNGNFAITEDGFYYQYNPYDIAPYAVGGTRLLLRKEQLKSLMRPDSPVYEIYFGETK